LRVPLLADKLTEYAQVLSDNATYAASYIGAVDAVLDYPAWYQLITAFGSTSGSLSTLESSLPLASLALLLPVCWREGDHRGIPLEPRPAALPIVYLQHGADEECNGVAVCGGWDADFLLWAGAGI
jgi:hypothetical protein